MDHPTRPAPLTIPYDHLSLPEDPAIIAACPRNIWSPWIGYGTLIGSVGTPPAVAHVGEFLVAGRPRRAILHCCGFLILN